VTTATVRAVAQRDRLPVSGAARREQVYIWLIVAAWAFVPEIRRVADWLVGTGSFPVINLIPLLLMVPLFWQALKRRKYGADMSFVIGCWLIAFGYGLFVALASGGLFTAFYDLAIFCVPMLVGLWTINASLDRRALFETLTSASLVIGTIVSIYGLYQFASPPPWDALWVQNSGLKTIGTAAPFQLRIFSTLNHPSTLSYFLLFAISVSLHRLNARRWWLVGPLLLCTLALGFTLVRAVYLALLISVFVYAVFCSRRRQLLGFGAVLAGLVLVSALSLPLLFGDQSGATGRLVDRLSTLTDLQHDNSALSREEQTSRAFQQSLEEPLGQGLGVVGTATRLTTGSTAVLDNGYMSRLTELGWIGFIAYLLAVGSALVFTLRRWYAARRNGAEGGELDLLATSIALQAALIGAELSGDAHNQLTGVFFWFMVGLALKQAPETAERRSGVRRGRGLGWATAP